MKANERFVVNLQFLPHRSPLLMRIIIRDKIPNIDKLINFAVLNGSQEINGEKDKGIIKSATKYIYYYVFIALLSTT